MGEILPGDSVETTNQSGRGHKSHSNLGEDMAVLRCGMWRPIYGTLKGHSDPEGWRHSVTWGSSHIRPLALHDPTPTFLQSHVHAHTHMHPKPNLGLSLTWVWGSWVLLRTGWWGRGPERSYTGPGPHGGCSQESWWERHGVWRGSPQPHSQLEQSLTRPTWRPGWALDACHELLQAAHTVLGHKDNLDPPLSVPKGGKRAGWGTIWDLVEEIGVGPRIGWQRSLRNKFILPLTEVKVVFVALLTHWAFHPLNPTSVLFFLLL